MMYYITFIDSPSGVFQSQVVDVINNLNQLARVEVKLVSFLPYADFFKNRKIIKNKFPDSIVLPILFGVKRWRLISYVIPFFTKKNATAMGRGPVATRIAMGRFKKVIYDGRAAVKAEIEEYNVTQNEEVGLSFIEAEREVVLGAHFKIAVSAKLIEFWRDVYGYKGSNHVVIPCTLSSESKGLNRLSSDDKIRIVYSGGTGGWQSFELVVQLLEELLNENLNVHVLFLTKENDHVSRLISLFPDRCDRKWLKHHEVFDTLSACDYGVLIREKKVTNFVASPVKFAEYLDAGLKVLISEGIGDLTEFSQQHKVGVLIKDKIPALEKVSHEEKLRLNSLAKKYFSKESPLIKESFKELILELVD